MLACVIQARVVPPARDGGDVPRQPARESQALKGTSLHAGSVGQLRPRLELWGSELDEELRRQAVAKPLPIGIGRCLGDACREPTLAVRLSAARTPVLAPVVLAWLLMSLSSRVGARRRVEALEAQATLVQLTLERSRHSGSGAPPKAPARFVLARF